MFLEKGFQFSHVLFGGPSHGKAHLHMQPCTSLLCEERLREEGQVHREIPARQRINPSSSTFQCQEKLNLWNERQARSSAAWHRFLSSEWLQEEGPAWLHSIHVHFSREVLSYIPNSTSGYIFRMEKGLQENNFISLLGMCHGMCGAVRGQWAVTISLPLNGTWGSNSGLQV